MTRTPWADGFSRLLAKRRGVKKGDIAKLAGVRAGTITALLKDGGKPPKTATLLAVAAAITELDRRGNPTAPEVELWEFFVSDEQAAALHQFEAARQEAARKSNPAAMGATIHEMMETLARFEAEMRKRA